ncbi:MAG: hypothetical protein CL678_08110 [Bdellovibrionaceae bacterium]|nr:hypothetical protein [Pseudobdellovibrionaceae bacterium]
MQSVSKANLKETYETIKDSWILFFEVFKESGAVFQRKKEIIHAIVHIGFESLPIITISTAFAGLVITNELVHHMDLALSSISMVPGFTGQFILRELGIAIPALLVVSKVGASMTAEMASMKITDQLEALQLLGVNRIRYLVFPRWIACIIAMVCLTLFSIMTTLVCAVGVAVLRYHFSLLEYISILRHFVGPIDIVSAFTKAVVFGSLIPVIACAYGFRCQGGAQGVGTSTTNAVVTATVTVIGWDFVLSSFFAQFMN